MQTYQMAMLLLFESVDSMTCKDIQETLQLNADTFQKHMQSLIESKLLVASSEVSYFFYLRFVFLRLGPHLSFLEFYCRTTNIFIIRPISHSAISNSSFLSFDLLDSDFRIF